MCDDTGLFQHAIHSVPDRSHGYCVDDNARALMVVSALNGSGEHPLSDELAARFAAFVQHAWNPERKRFRNFMGFDRHWTEEVGSEDSHARALWALGECARGDPAASRRKWAASLFVAASVETPDWVWFEKGLAYDNARLSQALIVTGLSTSVPSAAVAACCAAWRADPDVKWKAHALRAFAWFLGSNDLSTPLVDIEAGSCCDGLHPDRSNENRGGESVVSYLLALTDIRQLHRVGSIRLKPPLLRVLHTDVPPAPATH